MPEYRLLTTQDRDKLQDLIDRVERALSRIQNAQAIEPPIQTPEVYLALTSADGIPARIEGDNDHDIPGRAYCTLHRLLPPGMSTSQSASTYPGYEKPVYSMFDKAVPANSWILAIRDKGGFYWATAVMATDIDNTGGLTGTGGDPPPPCGEAVYTKYRYKCEAGDLNEYTYTVTIDHDGNGCLRLVEGPETLNQTIACCDTACAETGTGKSTGTGTDQSEITTECCLNPIPSTLTMTITGDITDTLTLTWNGSSYGFTGNTSASCDGNELDFRMVCTDVACTDWQMTVGCAAPGSSNTNPDSGTCVCNPLSLTFTDVPIDGLACNNGGCTTITIVVTE